MKLGERLLQKKIINEDHLQRAMDYQKENPEVRIGEALVNLGFIDMKTLVGTLVFTSPESG